MKANPQSKAHRVLVALSKTNDCTTRDYLRILKDLSDGRHDCVSNDLMTRGLVERRVVLTAKARQILAESGAQA